MPSQSGNQRITLRELRSRANKGSLSDEEIRRLFQTRPRQFRTIRAGDQAQRSRGRYRRRSADAGRDGQADRKRFACFQADRKTSRGSGQASQGANSQSSRRGGLLVQPSRRLLPADGDRCPVAKPRSQEHRALGRRTARHGHREAVQAAVRFRPLQEVPVFGWRQRRPRIDRGASQESHCRRHGSGACAELCKAELRGKAARRHGRLRNPPRRREGDGTGRNRAVRARLRERDSSRERALSRRADARQELRPFTGRAARQGRDRAYGRAVQRRAEGFRLDAKHMSSMSISGRR